MTHTHTHMRVVLLVVTPMDFTQPAPFFCADFRGRFSMDLKRPRFGKKKFLVKEGRGRWMCLTPVGSVGR